MYQAGPLSYLFQLYYIQYISANHDITQYEQSQKTN